MHTFSILTSSREHARPLAKSSAFRLITFSSQTPPFTIKFLFTFSPNSRMDKKAPSPPLCAHCEKPAALVCGACKDTPSYEDHAEGSIWYCTAECQKLDWTKHKTLCKSLKMRKQLYRAGSVLQDMFYMYREKVFDYHISKVEIKGSKIYLHLCYDEAVANAKRPPGARKDVFLPFPSEYVPNLRDKQAILVYSASADSAAWMFEMVQLCLEGEHISTIPLFTSR